MHARQFAQALALQEQNNWARFVTMQDHYNLIYREEENEMLPLCSRAGENDKQIAANLAEVAEELDAERAQVALAWLLSKPGVAAPIIGASRQEQLDELLHAVDLTLTPEQIEKLEAPYKPHPIVGFK